MPLGSASTVNTALHNLQRTAENAPMPLDAIEQRRAAREAEKIKKFDSISDRIKALAAKDSSLTDAARLAQEQADAAKIQQMVDNFTEISEESPAATISTTRTLALEMIGTGVPTFIEKGNNLLGKLEYLEKSGRFGTGTQREAITKSGLAKEAQETRKASSEADYLNVGAAGLREDRPPTDQEIALVSKTIKQLYPEKYKDSMFGVNDELLATTRMVMEYRRQRRNVGQPVDEQTAINDVESGRAQQWLSQHSANPESTPNMPNPTPDLQDYNPLQISPTR